MCVEMSGSEQHAAAAGFTVCLLNGFLHPVSREGLNCRVSAAVAGRSPFLPVCSLAHLLVILPSVAQPEHLPPISRRPAADPLLQ